MVGSASSPFAITAAANSVRLDAGQSAVTTFTVSNATGRTVNGRARLRPITPAAAAWLTIAGETDRLFAPNEAAQYSVNVAVPNTTPAGSYTFSLDVVGVDNPDEMFTQGPPVSIEVAAVVVPKKALPWWWWVPVAAVAALIVAVLAFVVLRPEDKEPVSLQHQRTFGSSGVIDLDSTTDLNETSSAADLQYLVSGESHLFTASNGASVFTTTTGNPLTIDQCLANANRGDIAFNTVPVGQTLSMCVRTNRGNTSLVLVTLVQRPSGGVLTTDVIDSKAATKFREQIDRSPSGLSAAEVTSIREVLAGNVLTPRPRQRNASVNYTTQSD